MRRLVIISLPLLVCFAATAAPDRRNTKCEWPQEAAIPIDLRNPEQQRHLHDDAELAEDLAVRYSDSGNWKVPGQDNGHAAYVRARNECMTALFSTIARNHGVTFEQVREALVQRPMSHDAVVLLSFTLFYFLVAYYLAKRVCHRFPFHESWHTALVTTVGASILVSFVGILTLETMTFITEGIRLGNGHLSDRANRIPWAHNRIALFAGGLFLFWLAAAFHHRAAVRDAEVSGTEAFRARDQRSKNGLWLSQ